MSKKSLSDLDYIADQLDTRFRGPFGFRFGWDGIAGFLPGVGDFMTSTFAFYIILRAALIGTPASVLLRMGMNVLIENVVDKIPGFGLLFDFIWKANTKNVALLRQSQIDASGMKKQSLVWVVIVLLLIIVVLLAGVILSFYALWLLAVYLGDWIQTS